MSTKNNDNQNISHGNIPKHIAIIMDGNGRWAKKRLLPRIAGHKAGMNNVKKITSYANKIGVKVLTLYAFSTENWKRPTDEVDYLMHLPVNFFDQFMPDLIAENVKVQVMGFTDELPSYTLNAVTRAQEQTKNNTGLILNFALNYGSRREIVQAAKAIALSVKQGELDVDQITEATLQSHLMTHNLSELADPDLLIRTSGEERLSNFLLWQLAYSEMVFTDEYWPDFDATSLNRAINEYQKRHRRYGGLVEK
ncbi:isoprenyl transferase [Lactobacillus sp. CC-MHH1034]|uniref:isoprenyl transferase n=1 Tax=Agrilactobacillus fermenti TaxID=2586909 RepID=UPI001E4AF589|nr:isoprenyl transferase [Agrilactobacillus fermenti]MCD2256253.1 isoprenyl transferase [Agrilactobacillus fermenti]